MVNKLLFINEFCELNQNMSSRLRYVTTLGDDDLDNLDEGIYRYNGYQTFSSGTKPFSGAWGIWFVVKNMSEKYDFVIQAGTSDVYTRVRNGSWVKK